MKICLFGGTFDPPHIGHLLIAQTVCEEESFDKKQYYCDNYKANLLVMGSDWENKFDYLDIPTLYFPFSVNLFARTQPADPAPIII